MKLLRLLAIVACLPVAAFAQSFNFKAIGDAPAVMYDSPSTKGVKRFVAPRGMPVEVVHVAEGWSKVRDFTGEMAWVETKTLGAKRTVIVTATKAKIRAKAEEAAAVTFTADKGVLLEIAEPVSSGWVKVKHRDGETGFVRVNEVWGA